MNLQQEQARLTALRRYEILDTPPDGAFDKLVSAAAKLFNMPIAIVSLVDEDRIWFKAEHGVGINQIGRDPGLCASAILSDEVYIVEDARSDPRTLANPLVAGNFGLQFYAAAPLTTKEGHRLGTFCLIDKKKRFLNEDQKAALADLAAVAMDEMDIRLAARAALKSSADRIAELEQEVERLRSGVKLSVN